jgi:hypothetical protein
MGEQPPTLQTRLQSGAASVLVLQDRLVLVSEVQRYIEEGQNGARGLEEMALPRGE